MRTETALLWRCYILVLLEISHRTRWLCLKCVIVYLARDIRPFVMYCVNRKPRSSLLIESTDSMILYSRPVEYLWVEFSQVKVTIIKNITKLCPPQVTSDTVHSTYVRMHVYTYVRELILYNHVMQGGKE